MGYTHYFTFKKKAREIEGGMEKFHDAAELFKEGLSKIGKTVKVSVAEYDDNGHYLGLKEVEQPFSIAGGNGYGEPIINDTEIVFNGDANLRHDYETFEASVDDYGFNFCKTARRPYDCAVCLALLCLKHYFGDYFEFHSDGSIEAGEEGWKLAKEIFDSIV